MRRLALALAMALLPSCNALGDDLTQQVCSLDAALGLACGADEVCIQGACQPPCSQHADCETACCLGTDTAGLRCAPATYCE